MTTIYVVLEFINTYTGNPVQILSSFLDLRNAYQLVKQIYLNERKNVYKEHLYSNEPLPNWLNDSRMLFSDCSNYLRLVPIYRIQLGDKYIAIIQTILQQ